MKVKNRSKNNQKKKKIESTVPTDQPILKQEKSMFDEPLDEFDTVKEEDITNTDFLSLGSKNSSELIEPGETEHGGRTFPKKYKVKETKNSGRYVWKSKYANFNLVDANQDPSEIILKSDSMNFRENMFNRHKRISSTAQLKLKQKQQVKIKRHRTT